MSNYQREYARRLRVALVGIGSHAYRNLLPAMNYLPVELVAICNRSDEELGKKTARQYGCAYYRGTAALYAREKPDAVFICVSPKAHPRLAIEAMEAGVHVWLEKPPAIRAGEIRQMQAKQDGLVCMVGYKKAFMPATRRAAEIIGSCQYGPARSVHGVYPVTVPPNGRQVLESGEFTDWLGNGCHPLSFLVAVGGRVQALTTLQSANGSGVCFLEYQNGMSGTLQMAPGPLPLERYSIFGERFNLHIENSSRLTLNRGIPFQYGVTEDFTGDPATSGSVVWEPQNGLATLENKALFTQGIVPELRAFCDCILDGKKPPAGDLDFALHVHRLYEAALVSEGKPIEIE